MAWVLNPHDGGAKEGAPPLVSAYRELIAQAIEAANAGADYTGVDHGPGIAAMLVRIGSVPYSVRLGRTTPPPSREVVAALSYLGAEHVEMRKAVIDWLYDIPLKQQD